MNLIRNIKIDLKRAFCSKLFLVGLLCMIGVCYLNISWDNMNAPSVIYLVSGLAFGGFVQMIFVCGAIPYATSYLSDLENGYIRFLVIRGDLSSYLHSKIIVTALSGFVTVWIGKMLFALSLRLIFPTVDEYTSMSTAGVDLLFGVSPWAYIVVDAFLYAMAAAGFAVMALFISSLVRNVFVTVMSPLVLFFMITSLQQIFNLPQEIELNGLLMGYITAYKDSWQFTLLHISVVWIIAILLVGKLFVWRAERRFHHG